MKLNYQCRSTELIKKNLNRLEIAKEVIDLLPRLPHIEHHLRRQSLLKSSLFSARIEGNQLNFTDVQFADTRSARSTAKKEVFNLLDTLNWLYALKSPIIINHSLILELHKRAMKQIDRRAGHFRTEAAAVFNQAGIAVYVAPPPNEATSLITQLIERTQQNPHHPAVKSAIFHFGFEKIHPFLDGNGRVGRLLSTVILKNENHDFRGLISPEEFFDQHRPTYYRLLASTNKDITPFVEFVLEGLVEQTQKVIEQLKEIPEEKPEDFLLPRRQEILRIIREHQLVSFDFLQRRFGKVPASSLHYDLKKLIQKRLVRKLGSTRGVRYTSNEKADG